jgi:uncharacterized membrane protein YoaT (DUF817 family)
MKAFLWEFWVFGLKEARACIFSGTFLALLLLSHYLPLFGLYRYDFLCLAAVALQVLLVATGLETRDELFVLTAFHALGLTLELFKVNVSHSWSYPEPAFLKIAGVPLFSGFMYAAVASYMCQAWRLLKLELENFPSYWVSVPLAAAGYLNFFTHRYTYDLRWWIIAAVFVVFWRTRVYFTVVTARRQMPLVLSFVLIGFFVWIAENFSTFYGAWVYEHQQAGWRPVSWRILSSWFLMVIVSGIIVFDLKMFRERLKRGADTAPAEGVDWFSVAPHWESQHDRVDLRRNRSPGPVTGAVDPAEARGREICAATEGVTARRLEGDDPGQ